ncbi:unnamed protein product [Cuscuta campestris]|uniref:Retrotransposon gag domain-containing protein n=1 Tax=Cuscuta campestris TaxID=132261 RepID=A0A484KN42_9ASTE|nr:unnamed protein product [Cuscuta campestris]
MAPPQYTVEKLKRNGAEEFLADDIKRPAKAEYSLVRTKRALKTLKVPEDDKPQLAVALLQDAAYDWWKRIERDPATPEHITSDFFKNVFKEEYVLDMYREAKRKQFTELKQNGRPLIEYWQEYDKLAEYGTDLMKTP